MAGRSWVDLLIMANVWKMPQGERLKKKQVELIDLLGLYSDPSRDERLHTISAVYMAEAVGEPKADDDAKSVGCFAAWEIPSQLCFDHAQILQDYWRYRNYGIRPKI
jgi:8-oxo-dGTP diphosphatase